MKNMLFVFTSLGILLSCNSADLDAHSNGNSNLKIRHQSVAQTQNITPEYVEFDRTQIRKQLQYKIDNNIPLVAHILVPLCDNTYQGIVPTTKSLGDGFNLKTNLYWATSNGIKRYFKEKRAWKMTKDIIYHQDSTILERVVFKKDFENGAHVILIADAYRGDKMEDCLIDFFGSLAGTLTDTIFANNDTILTNSKADLIAFNGHNGLMDVFVDETYNQDSIQKDAAVIACSSLYNFSYRLNMLQAYPLITTNNSLYPGAFIMEAVINNWAMMRSDEDIRLSAGDAYHRVKQCGLTGARDLFSTGW